MSKRIVHIGTVKENSPRTGTPVNARVFCKIEIGKKGEEGREELSITGVVGPTQDGNCIGSCGQINGGLRGYLEAGDFSFALGWDAKKLSQFLDIWGRWHLNGMNAATAEMRAAGWVDLARKEIFKYSFRMTSESRERLAALRERCIDAAIDGDFAPRLKDEEKRLLQSKSYADVYGYEQPEAPEFMELSKDILRDNRPKIERKTLGWVRHEEHPDGLLGRELNGKKYGSEWYYEPIPADVKKWLAALPVATVRPAWV